MRQRDPLLVLPPLIVAVVVLGEMTVDVDIVVAVLLP